MSQRVIQKVVLLILITPVFLVITGCEKSIHQAASSRDMERIKYLLEKDPNLLNKLDSFKRTPLHWATDMGNRNIAEFLINRGADVNIKDKFGKTPLDYAIDNATDGFDEIEQTSVIPAETTVAWKNTLHYPYPPELPDYTESTKSIAGLALGAKTAIVGLRGIMTLSQQEGNFTLVNTLFDAMDEVGFDQIFGG